MDLEIILQKYEQQAMEAERRLSQLTQRFEFLNEEWMKMQNRREGEFQNSESSLQSQQNERKMHEKEEGDSITIFDSFKFLILFHPKFCG